MRPSLSPLRFLAKQLLARDRSHALVPVCQQHIDRSLAQNNSIMGTNGELPFLAFAASCIHRGIAFDVGANVGDWAREFLARCSGSTVHCFEPHPETFASLKARMQAHPGAILHPVGLSSHRGRATLHSVSIDSGMSSLHKRESLGARDAIVAQPSLTVRLETGDALMQRLRLRSIDLIKIDTEGDELRVLQGMRQALKKKMVRMIQFEYGGTWIDSRTFLIDVWHFLERFGFTLYTITPDGLRRHSSYDPRLENFQYCNYAALQDSIVPPPPLRA